MRLQMLEEKVAPILNLYLLSVGCRKVLVNTIHRPRDTLHHRTRLTIKEEINHPVMVPEQQLIEISILVGKGKGTVPRVHLTRLGDAAKALRGLRSIIGPCAKVGSMRCRGNLILLFLDPGGGRRGKCGNVRAARPERGLFQKTRRDLVRRRSVRQGRHLVGVIHRGQGRQDDGARRLVTRVRDGGKVSGVGLPIPSVVAARHGLESGILR